MKMSKVTLIASGLYRFRDRGRLVKLRLCTKSALVAPIKMNYLNLAILRIRKLE